MLTLIKISINTTSILCGYIFSEIVRNSSFSREFGMLFKRYSPLKNNLGLYIIGDMLHYSGIYHIIARELKFSEKTLCVNDHHPD